MTGEEHDARGNIHFRASRSPDLGVVREQLSRPPSAFVYIVDEGKVVHDLLGKPAPNPLSGCDCTGNMTTRRLTIEDEERSEEHTSELQSLMRISYAVFCLKKKIETNEPIKPSTH